MDVIDETLQANQAYAQSFDKADLGMPPSRKLAVVCCMDARIHVSKALGLELGEAHIIRNAGGIVTEDVLRSLIISHHLLGTQEFMIVNHIDCGMLTFKGDDLRARLEESTGHSPLTPAAFYPFSDLQDNVRRQVQRIKHHPWIPDAVVVRGFIYDVKTGKVSEVKN
jgi:carbonic anhydrase